MRWYTFDHSPVEGILPREHCQSAKHEGKGVLAEKCHVLASSELGLVPPPIVYSMWFSCEPCMTGMMDVWLEANGKDWR